MNNISEVGRPDDLPGEDPIDTSDSAEVVQEDIRRAEIWWPTHRAESLIVDSFVLDWFKQHTADYHDTINRLMREYMEAHS
ncbi:MAG: hypothetical protein ACEQSK_14110 [Sphingomonadaceae bacterium]